MAIKHKPMRDLPSLSGYKKNDVLVIFGEVFSRGYVNGLIDEAQKNGLKVIYSTVGRRDDNNNLRALTQEELAEKKQTPLINVALEAGFDLEKSNKDLSPVDQLAGIKLSGWEEAKIDFKQVEDSRKKGIERFKNALDEWLTELEKHIPEGANILFAHTMAGGFPRAKVVMPAANRVFKGYDKRFFSSETFWNTDIGKLCNISFNEVTAETLNHLITATASLRKSKEKAGQHVSYVAYGYHGTDILFGNKYKWQSYSPYLQGWAKVRLEDIAKEAHKKGVKCTVFNAPEILTNSSSIFLGVEVCLYPLMGALLKEGFSHPFVQDLMSQAKNLLKEDHSIEEILSLTQKYIESDAIKNSFSMEGWPQHNSPEQMKMMRETSDKIINMHKNTKELMTSILSEVVFKSCGNIMFHESWECKEPVWWLGHDIVAKQTVS